MKLHWCQDVKCDYTHYRENNQVKDKYLYVLTYTNIEDMMDELVKGRWPCSGNLKANYRRNASICDSLWNLIVSVDINIGMNISLGMNVPKEWDYSKRINDNRDDNKSNWAYDYGNGL